MPKGRPINNPEQDAVIYNAHLAGETMASIAARFDIKKWNVNDACRRIRHQRRRERLRASYADWRDVPARYSTLSIRAQDGIAAMGIVTLGSLFDAIERNGETMFRYTPNVGPRTIREIMEWFRSVRP